MKKKNFAISWVIVALVVFVSIISYAFYCTSRGMNFAWEVNLHRPRAGLMMVKCYR